ncbi:hypothetical protein [Paenibacillus gansuensis]|uniref:Uncharacterized protein n=1 Tax=Paenibacillus gansuensis TaxID=306542 RepID=A0ABW5PHR6_9BACL
MYALPFLLISLSGIIALAFKISQVSSYEINKSNWNPLNLIRESESITTYLKTWIVKHPFVITFSVGFIVLTHQNLKSLEAVKTLLPQVPNTYLTAYLLLSVFLFYELFFLIISKVKHPINSVLKIITLLFYIPIYIYVGTTGASAIIKSVFVFLVGIMTGIVRNEILPKQIILGTIVLIAGIWAISYYFIKCINVANKEI